MVLFECASTIHWEITFYLLGGYFLCIFIFSIYPLIKYYRLIRTLDIVHKLQRYLLSFSLLLKTTYIFAHLINSQYKSNIKVLTILGFVFLEFPSHLISTVYSLFLLSWLSNVTDFLPSTYSSISGLFDKVILGYNIILYLLSFGYFAAYEIQGKSTLSNILIISSTMTRDFGLCLIFLCFLCIIRRIIKNDYYPPTREEASLSSITVILTLILFLRGVIESLQSFVFDTNNSSDNCRLSFYFLHFFFEVILESVPLIYLSTKNLLFCKERSTALSQSPLLSVDVIQGFR